MIHDYRVKRESKEEKERVTRVGREKDVSLDADLGPTAEDGVKQASSLRECVHALS